MDDYSRPNIILIVIDAARADHFSCYGYRRKTTPYIDQIAGEGVLYKNAISPAGWTLPAHASIFTGTYPSKHGAHLENTVLSDELPTLAEVLMRNGYKTCGFCTNYWITEATGLSRGFSEFYDFHYSKLETIFKRVPDIIRLRGRDSWGYTITNEVMKWIKHNSNTPYFLFVHYGELHLPYHIPAPYNSMFLPQDIPYKRAKKVNQNVKLFYAGLSKMSKIDFKISKDLYDGALVYLDNIIGEFYKFLKNNHLLDNTILIITSDHGESLGDHNHLDHYYVLYDTLLKVPLILRFPKLLPKGLLIDRQVQTLDIFPTILKILDIKNEDLNDIQGYPLPPLGDTFHPFTIAERFKDIKGLKESFPNVDLSHLKKFEDDRKTAIRTERYKLIYSQNGDSELFDIINDPKEENNIINEHNEIVEDLLMKINTWKSSFKPAKIKGQEARFDDEIKKRLKALGYLG